MNFDKNFVIGLVLMLALAIGISYYTASTQEPVATETAIADSTSAAQATPSVPETAGANPTISVPVTDSLTVDSSAAALESIAKYGVFAGAEMGTEQEVVVENNKIKVVLTTKGGLFKSATLVDGYTKYNSTEPIQLWDASLSRMTLKFNLQGKGEMTADQFYFVPSASSVSAKSGVQNLTMRLNSTDPNQFVELVYTIAPDAYDIPCKVNIVGLGEELGLGSQKFSLEWNATGHANEKGIQAERSKCSVYFCEVEGERDYLSESSDDEEFTENKVNWVALKQDYFSAAVISNIGFNAQAKLNISPATDSLHTKVYGASLGLDMTAGDNASSDLRFFFGPNDYKVLTALEVNEFDRIIDYGWSIIGWVNKYAIRPLFWFFSSFIGSFGLIILIVTLIIKMVLFPVTWKNFLSSAKMRVLKPEIDEINKKYENKEAVEKQQAIMALYRQTGVNPFAGCIPVLLQMPILYAMFRFFPAEIVLRGQSFLWADDLAAYDSILSLPFNIPFYGNHVSGFTLLMVASTFLYTRMSMQATPTVQQPGMPNMKVMMNIFSFMMLFFFNSMPSGLSMYYFTANVISIGQMWTIKKYFIDEDAIRAKIESNKTKPKKKSSFAQRLEEMQKEQQKKIHQQKNKLK